MIKLCRLNTGETVVGKVDEDKGKLENVLLLQAQPDPTGQGIRMGIAPYWAPYSRAEANIDIDKIVADTDADPQLRDQYMQITTGIVTATPADLKNIGGQPIPFPGK